MVAAPSSDFPVFLNGQSASITGTAPQVSLLDFVRSRGLTGAKEGCAEGECGACAVLLDGYAVNSCLVPLPAVAGRDVRTVEGLGSGGKLTPVQNAMIEHGGSQCGYCTPGFVISMSGGACEPDELGGNLCRCTGYRPIADALRSVRPAAATEWRSGEIRPLSYATAAGRFSRPGSLEDCFGLMAADPEARLVAGNTDLGVETNLRDRRFAHLISLEAMPELREFADGPDAVEIGAALTLSEIERQWLTAPGAFHQWLRLFASPLIRNRATLGGSIVTASPIGDSAPLLLALDAGVKIASAGGERVIPLNQFFVAYRKTALKCGELVRSILIPKPFAVGVKYFKVAKRRMDDISTVAAGIVIERDARGMVSKARFAFGGVAAVPMRAQGAERAFEGTDGGDAALGRVTEELQRTLNPISDHRGSAAYRMAVAQNLVARACAQ